MSTSCKPALGAPIPEEVRPFPYAELPTSAMEGSPPMQAASGNDRVIDTSVLAAIEAARQEGEAKARAAFDRQLTEVRDGVRSALEKFAEERASYYQKVEREVVQLALSIARKILRREAQIDPLLLAGMVRVALEKIESGTKVVVRVNPQQVSECRAYFAQHMDPRQVPEVIEDRGLAMHHCVLQTVLGNTELGPEVQLKEIEQGLLDLLGQRPAAAT
jgi:flagellar assembly protein FliH